MNTWEQQFTNHQIHAILEEIGQITDGAKIESDDPGIVGSYNRLLQINAHVRTTLDSANPNLTWNSPLLGAWDE